MEDGSPHSVPVWIDIDDQDRLVFYKEDSSIGLRNLKRDPRVAVSVTDVENPYRSVIVRGHLVQVRGEPAACEWLNQGAFLYTGRAYPDPVPESLQPLPLEVDKVDLGPAQNRPRVNALSRRRCLGASISGFRLG
jgi:Pyridoxamine 5'-phosphate oxidase